MCVNGSLLLTCHPLLISEQSVPGMHRVIAMHWQSRHHTCVRNSLTNDARELSSVLSCAAAGCCSWSVKYHIQSHIIDDSLCIMSFELGISNDRHDNQSIRNEYEWFSRDGLCYKSEYHTSWVNEWMVDSMISAGHSSGLLCHSHALASVVIVWFDFWRVITLYVTLWMTVRGPYQCQLHPVSVNN